METLPKLTPTQALVLRAAARRADGRVIPPANLRGGARVKALSGLLWLTLPEPAIIQAILAAQQPRCISQLRLQRNLPPDGAAFDR